jgi:hypothetical protein
MTPVQDSHEVEIAISAAIVVVDAHMAGLNDRDPEGLARSLHFPHYRLAGGKLKTWEKPDTYFDDFLARAGDGWARSEWDKKEVIGASPDKIHLDMVFTRYRSDGSSMGSFRSIWVIAKLDGRWAAQLRTSFAK